MRDEINREDSSGLSEQQSEISLLNELVAQYLAHDGYIETAKAFAAEIRTSSELLRPGTTSTGLDYKEDLDAINRQRSYSQLMIRHIAKYLQEYAPPSWMGMLTKRSSTPTPTTRPSCRRMKTYTSSSAAANSSK